MLDLSAGHVDALSNLILCFDNKRDPSLDDRAHHASTSQFKMQHFVPHGIQNLDLKGDNIHTISISINMISQNIVRLKLTTHCSLY